ncbi:MAG: hypothetical protein RR977_01655 [Oscillospiraceae bacterium]
MKLKELKSAQRKKLLFHFLVVTIIGTLFLSFAASTLYKDKKAEDRYWDAYLETADATHAQVEQLSANATSVTVGTYVENLKELSLKSNNFQVTFLAWFRWEDSPDLDIMNHFRIYKGMINKMQVVKDYHEGSTNYQLVRCDATVSKNYWTLRFPLETHQLRFYLELDFPIEQAVLVADRENSGYNKNLSISGYKLMRYDNAITTMQYENTRNDPELTKPVATSEFVTAIEINRSSWGLYTKCFIALVGTITWVLITLFLSSYHHVDPLAMIPAALFGTVSNIMVGANLLPDALEIGLLEYVNIWGILTILAGAISLININRIRNKYDDHAFAGLFGRVMFYTILFFAVAGNLILPISAYVF